MPELQQRVLACKSAVTNRQPYTDPGDSLETLLVLMTRLYTFSPSLCLEEELRWAAFLQWTWGEHHVCKIGREERVTNCKKCQAELDTKPSENDLADI